ncbi:Pentatricopeptide repeat-containing protein [Sesamum alatum]|uniref:Pentatricopeptide repeat-containing protein n=1 Tax=Sesamum alatum TaxID=300844 RepID=A0AAE2CRQ9_9LAMI|nr:Pentatricopeptide repeat-containing protein [Sesamum alatum]
MDGPMSSVQLLPGFQPQPRPTYPQSKLGYSRISSLAQPWPSSNNTTRTSSSSVSPPTMTPWAVSLSSVRCQNRGLELCPQGDSFCQNNLIHMYVHFESLEEVKRVFDSLDKKDTVSWTTLISGYSHWGSVDEAFGVFESMPLVLGLVHWSKVSGYNSSAIKVASKLATTIMDIYCKCGHLDKAFEVFSGLSSKGVSSLNCMIEGFAMHGKGKVTIELLKKMEAETMVNPDYVSFVNVLGARAHSGLVEEGR